MKDPEGEARDGLRLASRAIELGKDDANVFWMAGYAILRFQMDQPRARELVHHSLELNPNSAIALAIAGEIEANLGNTDEALELLFRAARLSPRDPRGWFITSKMAWAYTVGGQFDEAISAANKVLNQNPRSAYADARASAARPAIGAAESPKVIINGLRRAFAPRLGRQDCGPIDMAPPAQARSRWHRADQSRRRRRPHRVRPEFAACRRPFARAAPPPADPGSQG
jgi:tetratricopeptide (TPR) repeat protein